jgi:hypothetical protein
MEYPPAIREDSDCTVLELLDRVLNTGVVLVGDVAITVADVELIYLRLQLLVSSAETAREAGWLATRPACRVDTPSACRPPHGTPVGNRS